MQEATYGTHIHEAREVREARFTCEPPIIIKLLMTGTSSHYQTQSYTINNRVIPPAARVHDIVTRGGHCLVPVFALGRAQELLLILDEYWAAHPELHDIPIYYASSLAKKCMAGRSEERWDCHVIIM